MGNSPLDSRGLPEGYEFREGDEITPGECLDRLNDPSDPTVLLDVREDDELRIASIDGAIHRPLGTLMEHHEDLADDLESGRDTPIAVICHHGVRSLRATLALRALGFADVVSVAGGIDLWSRGIDPSVPRY
ncbi:MAG: rhodanese-like domain-containing protein [Planctomycetota bacterium]